MEIRRLFIVAILGIAIVGGLTNCESSMTKKALNYGDNLKDAIENFEETRKDISNQVVKSVDNTSNKLSEENPDLPEVAIDWESQWQSIQRKFETMQEEFSDVGNKSEDYFQQLEELSSGIEDETIKHAELQKNKELKNNWTKEYVEASNKIQELREILIEGNDFQRVLIASSIRQKIESNISELKSISKRAKSLMRELEKFTIEGKKLVD